MLLNLPLSRSKLDRAAHLRSDSAALDELFSKAKIISMVADRFECSKSGLTFISPELARGERYFLGLSSDGQAYFVAHQVSDQKEFGENFQSLRTLGAHLSDLEIGAAVHSLALSQWHQSHMRCSKCGEDTKSILGGSVRKCLVCSAEHHPRTDPAIIVLVKDSKDRILLGRQKVWPEKRFSTFAGFVEPGESFESCVIREVAEECGGIVTDMNYLGSQPWPFPASVMIAYEANISNPDSVVADGQEIQEIIWLTREELKLKCESGELLLPPIISVARAMINAWYGPTAESELSGQSWRN